MLSDHTCCYSLRFFLARQLLTVIIVIIVITRLLSRYYTAVIGTAISTIIFAVFSLFSLFLVRLIPCYYFLIILIILQIRPLASSFTSSLLTQSRENLESQWAFC